MFPLCTLMLIYYHAFFHVSGKIFVKFFCHYSEYFLFTLAKAGSAGIF